TTASCSRNLAEYAMPGCTRASAFSFPAITRGRRTDSSTPMTIAGTAEPSTGQTAPMPVATRAIAAVTSTPGSTSIPRWPRREGRVCTGDSCTRPASRMMRSAGRGRASIGVQFATVTDALSELPDLRALRLLAAAVRHGSISAAARECGVTQQSASARLRSVERMLGLELLQRTTRGVEPTPAGETAAAWAEEVLAAAERFRIGVGTLRGERRRELTVAASQTVA